MTLLGLSACSTARGNDRSMPSASTSTITDSSATRTSTGWTRRDLRPISEPVAVGDVVVTYVAGEENPRIVAVDARTGATLWEHGATPAATTPGVAPRVEARAGLVFWYSRSGSRMLARLVASDARTGKVAWRSQVASFHDWPYVCVDDPTSICVTSNGPDGSVAVRLRARSGAVVRVQPLPGSRTARELEFGLFDTGSRNPEALAAMDRDGVRWTEPLAMYFPSGASTDRSWNFSYLPSLGLYVGSAGNPIEELPGDVFTNDLADATTVGISIEDGSLVWRDAGASYECGSVPCPTRKGPGGRVPTAGVRLRMSGTITAKGDEDGTWSTDGRTGFEGFDLATGRTTWSYDAGHDEGLLEGGSYPQLDDTTIVLGTRRKPVKPVALDLVNGSHRRLAVDAQVWCAKRTKYPVHPALDNGDVQISEYTGAELFVPCRLDGSKPDRPPEVPAWVGARAGGMVVWAQPRSVTATRSR